MGGGQIEYAALLRHCGAAEFVGAAEAVLVVLMKRYVPAIRAEVTFARSV
jgi:hypothetical protein